MILLLSTYEMGRQPFGLASPAAWLRQAGFDVRCLDLSVETLDETAVQSANLIAFYVPMHMATRMATGVLDRVRHLNPQAHICFYGLYAPENADYLHSLGVDTLLGGEFETGLVTLAQRLASLEGGVTKGSQESIPLVSLDRQQFLTPDRAGLPGLDKYAHLITAAGQRLPTGYVEASRGCKHLCRHCPIVPVYNGRFRIIQHDVVLADIAQQVAAGAGHITFGDPDFFNGPGHAIPLVQAVHEQFPDLTYDVTIKVTHLLKHVDLLPLLKETGCLFITTAVEAFDERILTIFEKQHTMPEFETVLAHCREIALPLVPTFVAFTPWTTLAGYRHFLTELVRLALVDQVAPIQLTIRLLIPPGSRLLELPEVRQLVTELQASKFVYNWRNPDPYVDNLQRQLEQLVQRCSAQGLSRRETFQRVWELAHQDTAVAPKQLPLPPFPAPPTLIPHLTEPWYC